MDDLHKPLGKQSDASSGKSNKKSAWFFSAVVFCAACLFGLAAYFLIDWQPNKTLVAINDTTKNSSTPLRTTQESDTSGTAGENTPIYDENGNLDLSKVKPLSPLEPIDEPDGTAAGVAATPAPSFKPRPTPPRQLSAWVPLPDLIEQSDFGPLPKSSDGGVRPLDAYSTSGGTIGASRVAIIIGGLGLSQTGTQKAIADLPSEITLGFSPFGNSLQRWMQAARREGHEVVLQLPMEPLGYPTIDPGPRTLTSTASVGDNLTNLHWSMARMTNYPLVMNYLGAGMNNKPDALLPILQEVKKRGLGYIDDGSMPSSLSMKLAKDMRLPHAKGSFVLDKNRDADRIKAMLTSLEAQSKRTGFAIGTATAFPETVKVIQEWVKDAPRRGILVVPASNLVKDYSGG